MNKNSMKTIRNTNLFRKKGNAENHQEQKKISSKEFTFLKYLEKLQKQEYKNHKEQQVSNNKLKVLYKEVGKDPVVKIIHNTLAEKQKLVGGLIDIVQYGNLLIACNDLGKVWNLPPNIIFDLDYIAGNFFVVGDDYKNHKWKSLTEEEIIKTKEDLIKRSFRPYRNIKAKQSYIDEAR